MLYFIALIQKELFKELKSETLCWRARRFKRELERLPKVCNGWSRNRQIGGNFEVETVVSSVSYLPQPGTAKIKMFSHDFEKFPLKKQNVEVKKGIGLCCQDF